MIDPSPPVRSATAAALDPLMQLFGGFMMAHPVRGSVIADWSRIAIMGVSHLIQSCNEVCAASGLACKHIPHRGLMRRSVSPSLWASIEPSAD